LRGVEKICKRTCNYKWISFEPVFPLEKLKKKIKVIKDTNIRDKYKRENG